MTSKPMHTPGPWIVCAGNALAVHSAAPRAHVAVAHIYGHAALGEQDANAHLIAAAPDLLEALEMVRDADDDCITDGLETIPGTARSRIDAAIAKATGVQP